MLQSFSALLILLIILLASFYFLLGGMRMPWLGKILGLIVGFIVARELGAIAGLVLGHIVDMLMSAKQKPTIIQPTAKEESSEEDDIPTATEYLIYADTLFSVLGNFAHAAGTEHTVYLNKLHIIMDQMELNAEQQRSAWEVFKYGQHNNFNLGQALFIFSRHCTHSSVLEQQLMRHLLDMASLKLPLTLAQYSILCMVAHALKVPTAQFAHFAPNEEQAKQENATENTSPLAQAYRVLGVKSTANTTEVKAAYRKLISRYHPDRLMAKDLPSELIEFATHRTQEIKAAYDKIMASR